MVAGGGPGVACRTPEHPVLVECVFGEYVGSENERSGYVEVLAMAVLVFDLVVEGGVEAGVVADMETRVLRFQDDAAEVVEEVLRTLKELAADVRELIDKPQKSSDAQKAVAAALVKELNALETQQDRLYEFLEKGIYTSEVFVKRNAALSQRPFLVCL